MDSITAALPFFRGWRNYWINKNMKNIEQLRLKVVIPFLMLTYIPMFFIGKEDKLLWLTACLANALLFSFFMDKINNKISNKIVSCAATTTLFHTFRNDSQWSCDCGKIKKYQIPELLGKE